jgi:hypothetical protein
VLEPFSDLVETIRFSGFDGCADGGDERAVGCEQGCAHHVGLCVGGTAVEGEPALADFGELGEELLDGGSLFGPARSRRRFISSSGTLASSVLPAALE